LHSGIFLKIAKEIKFIKQEAHVSDYYNHVQSRLIQACNDNPSHVRNMAQ